jgi:biotin operon repressor
MKGVWIPVELIEMDISWTKRILLAEISQLEMLDKGCVASNAHFSEKLKLSKQAISKALNELNKDGYIQIDNAQAKRNFGRKITINFGKSGINFGKSGIHQSGESKESNTINNPINKESKRKRFTPPTLEEAVAYCNNPIEAEKFWHYYESNGWKVGKNKMKNWKSALTGWIKRSQQYNKPVQSNQSLDDVCDDFLNELMSQPSDPTYLYGGRR